MKNITLPTKIKEFVRYDKKPNAIKYGTLYTRVMHMEVPYEQKRTLRVYLPEGFSFDKSYPVMYMCDAQNIVDRYTSAYGEWDFDEHIHNLLKQGYPSFIIVGFDCPKNPFNRAREYTMSETHFKSHGKDVKGYGQDYAKYMINVIKPLIDQTFPTIQEQEYTAFGGSSMGGLCAFDIASLYPETFGFSLSFSPAFFVLKTDLYKKEVANRTFYPNEQKYFFFSGCKDLDARILPGTVNMYRYMKKIGFDDEHVALVVDSEYGHCEAAWSAYVEKAIKFWLKNKEN